MAHDETPQDAAAAWAVRVGDPGFDDWESFTAWLEQSPEHAAAYDRMASAVAFAAAAEPPLPAPAQDVEPEVEYDEPSRRSRRWLIGGAVAAAVAAGAIGSWQWSDSGYAIETRPGEMRTVALADGGSVVLAGATRIELDHDAPRRATLDHGQALFTVRHNPQDPFRLRVGDDRLVDIGTVFDVKHVGGAIRVAVAEGAVAFNPDTANVRLTPGDVLSGGKGASGYQVTHQPAALVGEWSEGRLTFRDQPLSDIAADLSRMTGLNFAVAADAAPRTLSGSVRIDSVRKDPKMLAPLFGVTVRQSQGGWTIG